MAARLVVESSLNGGTWRGHSRWRAAEMVPQYGMFENINSLQELAKMPQWREENPLRVATGFTYLGNKFMKENGLKHVKFSTADGALEAAPVVRESVYFKKALYKAIQQLRAIGGSGILISPLTYIFDEKTPRWRRLLSDVI